MSEDFDFMKVLAELDGGVLTQKMTAAFKDAAISVAAHGDGKKVSKLNLEFTMSRVGESAQIMVAHRIVISKPTPKGKKSEENTTETLMYVSSKGPSVVPDTQEKLKFDNA